MDSRRRRSSTGGHIVAHPGTSLRMGGCTKYVDTIPTFDLVNF